MAMATVQREVKLADLVRTHQAGVWRYLRFLGCDRTEADDLTQETFLTVIKTPFEHRSSRETAAYLRKVARNRLLAVRRKQKRVSAMGDLDYDLDQAEAVWAEMAGDNGLGDYLAALEDCLQAAVTPKAREAIDLKYREDASRDEIADQLKMAADGVKTLLRRARSSLRDCVERKLNR